MELTEGKSISAVIAKPDASSKNWYFGLDGVRALAVLLVFSVHFMAQPTASAGWTGVLLFFVLSGFLITGLLYDNQDEPFRFRNFYIRRTLRIFPLFYFSWLLVLIGGLILHADFQSSQLLWIVYLGNFLRFMVGSPVQDHIFTAYQGLPLEIGHFWSLAVEEQFYLVWPLVVFTVRKRSTLIRICLLAVVLVPLLRTAFLFTLPSSILSMEFSYRMILTQCDGFLLGGLLALWMRGPEKEWMLRHSHKIIGIPFVAFLVAYLVNNHFRWQVLSATSPWMSTYGFTLVDLMAAGLILSSLRPHSAVYRVLTLPPLRLLGKYSYGFYVYHVLMRPFLLCLVGTPTDAVQTSGQALHLLLSSTICFMAIFAVAACSYHFVEQPFLKTKDRFTMHHKNPGSENALVGG